MVYGVDADGRAGAWYGVGAASLMGYWLDTRAGAGAEAGYGEAAASLMVCLVDVDGGVGSAY